LRSAGTPRATFASFARHFSDDLATSPIATRFGSSSDPLERAQLLCCLSNLEKGRRNALMGRVKDEGPWVARAVKLMRLAPTGGN
jgi:hypothetical protein